jgi:hypothetical protein
MALKYTYKCIPSLQDFFTAITPTKFTSHLRYIPPVLYPPNPQSLTTATVPRLKIQSRQVIRPGTHYKLAVVFPHVFQWAS